MIRMRHSVASVKLNVRRYDTVSIMRHSVGGFILPLGHDSLIIMQHAVGSFTPVLIDFKPSELLRTAVLQACLRLPASVPTPTRAPQHGKCT